MASDKNGFILYKDLIHVVRKLPKEKQADLFMHILRYVNDENPETDDLIIELTFEPIKQSLKNHFKKRGLGKYHWNWKNGKTPHNRRIRQSTEYKDWRKQVFERDNYTCQSCNVKGGNLHAHHIKLFSEFPKLRTVVSNGITLCNKCHNKEHKRLRNEQR